MFDDFIYFVRSVFDTDGVISLHEPVFRGQEKKYLLEAVDSTFVSSTGEFVNEFEKQVQNYTGIKYGIATVNGTSALHICLLLSGATAGTEVITQSLTFVATCNAIRYCGARPIFVDVNRDHLGLSPVSLDAFLSEHCELRDDGFCWNRLSNKPIVACVPMHTLGFPAELDEISRVCQQHNICVIEDAAESLGSVYKSCHTGSVGKLSAFSFNGNKIVTTGGGGMVVTNDEELAQRAKHLITTAKTAHRWSFQHDEIGYNYRLPNLNAAMGVAQMESLPAYLDSKRVLAKKYHQWGDDRSVRFIKESVDTEANYWLNAVVTENRDQRDAMLEATNKNNILTRPVWTPMHRLSMNHDCHRDEMKNTNWLYDRLVNVPSSVLSYGTK